MDETKTLHLDCYCGTHILRVTSNLELKDDGKRFFQEFYLAMFSYDGINNKVPFLQRLKFAFKYLRTSKVYDDQIVLTPEQAKQLSDWLKETIQ
jgi:hypothetical protein